MLRFDTSPATAGCPSAVWLRSRESDAEDVTSAKRPIVKLYSVVTTSDGTQTPSRTKSLQIVANVSAAVAVTVGPMSDKRICHYLAPHLGCRPTGGVLLVLCTPAR